MVPHKHREGAGFFIISPALDRVLVLDAGEYLDVPKGCRERNETALQTAQRETWEEAGISILESDMRTHENFQVGNLFMFLAMSSKKPVIKQNPRTGVKEHISGMYVPWRTLEGNCEEFLLPAIAWAKEKSLG